jgi:hypothetical protein
MSFSSNAELIPRKAGENCGLTYPLDRLESTLGGVLVFCIYLIQRLLKEFSIFFEKDCGVEGWFCKFRSET